jgi:hypothetical protein
MSIKKYQNQSFTNETFQLEECWFVNCVLKNCTIFFAGGSYEMEQTSFENCQYKFQNEAQRTCQLLGQIGVLPIPQTIPQTTQPPNQVN